MENHDRLEIQHHPNHRKRPWWVVEIMDEEEGYGAVLSTHVSEDGAKRKLRTLRKERSPGDDDDDDQVAVLTNS